MTEHRLLERAAAPSHVVRREQLALREDGADLGVQRVERRGVPWRSGDAARGDGAGVALLELEEDQQRHVAAVGRRPVPHLCEARHQPHARRL